MLYDKRWDKQVKAHPFALESLIAWLEKQPAETEYEYMFPDACLVGQWLRGTGVQRWKLSSTEVSALFDRRGMDVVWEHPRTFGAALARAKALQP